MYCLEIVVQYRNCAEKMNWPSALEFFHPIIRETSSLFPTSSKEFKQLPCKVLPLPAFDRIRS